jgi:hypothetical protein
VKVRMATLLVATSLGAGIAVFTASASTRTTQPVLAYKIQAVLTDKAVSIKGHSSVTWPRGAVIQFIVTNRGTRPYKAQVKLTGNYHFSQYEAKITSLRSRLIPPSGQGTVRVFFYYRSTFALQALLDAKPHGKPAVITIR